MLSKNQINVDLFDEVTRLKREIEKKNYQLRGLAAMKNIEKQYEFAFMKRLDGERV
ncbi:hypothetical protein NSS76_13190 [Bacillus sp. FSL R5-0654]|uniref:hypothetical protein n=1 Tax=Bacillus sp. FSL R5-0654 TaxID=2954589 RepID=UPI0030FA9F84